MGALLDDLLADYKINGKCYEWADHKVRVHIRPFFGGMKAAKIGTDQIRAFIAKAAATAHARLWRPKARIRGGVSNGTINRELALLRRAFNLGHIATPAKVAAVPFIPMLTENNVRKGFFEHDAYLTVRRALPEEIRPILAFAYFTGCRKGEILGLQWRQLDLSERVVRLEPGETKNDEGRTIS